MKSNARQEVTALLSATSPEERESEAQKLIPLLYNELRDLARRYFRRERHGHTLQPTALVHEAYLRLVDETRVEWQGRTHFRGVCAKVMRRVLIDYARARDRVRRGGGHRRVMLDSMMAALDLGAVDAREMHDALGRLAELDPRQAEIVELRFFGGLSVDEVAEILGVSKRTVEGDWTHAKAWLRAEFGCEPPP